MGDERMRRLLAEMMGTFALVFAGTQLGAHWVDIRKALQPFDLAMVVLVVLAVVAFIWFRLGRPGWRRV